MSVQMVPLHAASIEEHGPRDFVKVDCAACGHTALLTPEFLARWAEAAPHGARSEGSGPRSGGVVFEAEPSYRSNGERIPRK